jgi:hypothetical protein
MNTPFFNSKQPTQQSNYVFNFGPIIGNTTILSVNLSTFLCLNGIDPNISSMIIVPLTLGTTPLSLSNGSTLPANTYATITLGGGIVGMNYLLSAQATTPIPGFTPVVSGIVPIRQF